MNVLKSYLKKTFPYFSVPLAFELLPARSSPYPELNKVRKSIRAQLRESSVIPSSTLHGKMLFCHPSRVIKMLPNFRKILLTLKSQNVPLKGLLSLKKYVLHSSLDLDKYSAVQKFLGVEFADGDDY